MSTFPNIRQEEGSLHCGPYCVVACLQALNKLPLRHSIELRKLKLSELGFKGPFISLNESYDFTRLALDLYKVTGIITPGEKPDYIEHSGYNSIAAMIYVLSQFGLKSEVVIRDEQTREYLEMVFPTEFKLIEKLAVPIEILGQNISTPSKTMLISVISINESLHYIANNALGEWFDSDIEEAEPKWECIEKWHLTRNKREGATWLGVSIRVAL
ncbi:hypothetical protein AB4259_14480 [Vibrio amylolyticus]|uniref:hypothetical protein n=1 Tax=Vibrio amylolyticus TaxID=2847292 RepID=UPI00354EA5DB